MKTIYALAGTTTYATGSRGVVVGVLSTYGTNPRVTGAFVREDGGDMEYVTLGNAIAACNCGAPLIGNPCLTQCNTILDRRTHYEVKGSSKIDRDEFDRLNGLDQLRAELGWR